MINIALHLNAYQPPTQLAEVYAQVVRESYEPVACALERHPNIRPSLNITRSLGERLPKELLHRYQILHGRQQIEFLNTAAYHYLLPLVPPAIIRRQFALNLEFCQENLLANNNPMGVYLPEYAFSPELVPILLECGYPWTILDDGPFEWRRRHVPKDEQVPFSWIPAHSGLACLLRSRYWSERIAKGEYSNGSSFAKELIEHHEQWIFRSRAGKCPETDSFIVLGVDFETFGHHPVDPNGPKDAIPRFLIPFCDKIAGEYGRARMVHPSIIYERFEHRDSEDCLIAGSWITQREHLERGIPFPLWNHPNSQFHRAWNQFMAHVLNAVSQSGHFGPELIHLTDQAFYSCSPWQYSNGNRDIASWCLPLFRRIIDGFGQSRIAESLAAPYRILEKLCRN